MQTRIEKWDDGLAIRIPQAFASQSHLEPDSLVELFIENGKIVLMPASPPEISLAQLLENVTDENLHDEIETAASNEVMRQETRDFFAQAAADYDPQAFADALSAVPNVPPVSGDEI